MEFLVVFFVMEGFTAVETLFKSRVITPKKIISQVLWLAKLAMSVNEHWAWMNVSNTSMYVYVVDRKMRCLCSATTCILFPFLIKN